jgi:hypothetical protein
LPARRFEEFWKRTKTTASATQATTAAETMAQSIEGYLTLMSLLIPTEDYVRRIRIEINPGRAGARRRRIIR